MIEFMLHHPSQITLHLFFMLHKILVHIFHANFITSFHCFMNTGKTETALFHVHFFAPDFQNVGINISLIEVFKFRILLRKRIQRNSNHANRQTNLRSSQSYAIGVYHCFKHVFNQLFQVRIIRCYILCNLSQYRLTIYINR